VTVCIAVACNQGTQVIAVTDGKLSYGDICGDVKLPKMAWFGDWMFLYAGEPAQTDSILEEIRMELLKIPDCLSREKIQATVRRAFKKRFAKWSVDRNLPAYDMEMDQFTKKGRKIFGDQKFTELCREIEKDAVNFREELLVIGWGKTIAALMLYEVNRDGARSHALHGLATLGFGADVAMSTLLLLGCGRDVPFEDALYAAAAAKFAAERCDGVGKDTTIFVTHKRIAEDDSQKAPGCFIPQDDISILRELWEEYSKPKIPEDALLKLHQIAQRAGTSGGLEIFMRLVSGKLKPEP
jgi:hypothetical protein